MSRFTISVPASTANVGPGFDSIGMALNRYLTLHVMEHKEWDFEHRSPHLPAAPSAQEHFIYQVAKKVAEQLHAELPACKVIVESEIPLARGMGSSASAVIAGIELANQLGNLNLTAEEKLFWATEIEGHPDNVAAALFGGLVVTAVAGDEQIDYFQLASMDLDLILYIPDFELKTETARMVLPESFSRSEAASASGIGNVMVAALITGDFALAGKMMEKDMFHEPYRSSLIPNYDGIRREAKEMGAYGTVISGAGPTMISFAPKGKGSSIVQHMQEQLPNYSIELMKVDSVGLRVDFIENTASK